MRTLLLLFLVAAMAGCASNGGNTAQEGEEEQRAATDGVGFTSGVPIVREGDPSSRHQQFLHNRY